MITIYTDGSCSKNPGPGGFGVIIVEDNVVVAAYQEREDNTTNNRMEMKAIIYALETYGASPNDFTAPIVYSDSSYCVNSFTNWIKGWKANGWARAGGKKLENLDLIKTYDMLCGSYKIDLRKIKGHAGEPGNIIADLLATGKVTPEEVLTYGLDIQNYKQYK